MRNAPTPVDVTVINLPGVCRNTLAGGLVYEPENDTCVVAPSLQVSPSPVAFDATPAGSSSSEQFIVNNNGAGSLNVTSLNITGVDFGFNAGCTVKTAPGFVIGPFGSSAPITAYYCPQQNDGGADQGLLTILSNDPASPTQITLQGQEAFPIMSVAPQAVNFTAPYPSQQTFSITNSGTGTLNYQVTGAAAPFSIVANGAGAIAPGDPPVDVTVEASGAGAGGLTVSATNPDAQGSPVNVTLTAP